MMHIFARKVPCGLHTCNTNRSKLTGLPAECNRFNKTLSKALQIFLLFFFLDKKEPKNQGLKQIFQEF